jgi:uncharacterized protein YjbI with pentapeptide repeats
MADHELVKLLKQGSNTWNKWRIEHPYVNLDLSTVDLSGTDLSEANLSTDHRSRVNLREINFREADLKGTNFSDTDLRGADFSGADLIAANFSGAILSGNNFCGLDLRCADFVQATLDEVDFRGADLSEADFSQAILKGANLSTAIIGWTKFGDRDFRELKGLENTVHKGPTPLSINSIYLSRGEIPDIFVKRCGVDDSFVAYMHALARKPLDYSSCFISHSSKNQDFAERLYADLQNKGVRCWLALHDMRTGDKIRECIDETIRLYDKVLLILSEHAITSSWVETEVETALEKERQMRERGNPQTVLFPLCLDDTIWHTTKSWAKEVRRRYITDFTGWKQHDDYQKAFHRLIHDLKASTTS